MKKKVKRGGSIKLLRKNIRIVTFNSQRDAVFDGLLVEQGIVAYHTFEKIVIIESG